MGLFDKLKKKTNEEVSEKEAKPEVVKKEEKTEEKKKKTVKKTTTDEKAGEKTAIKSASKNLKGNAYAVLLRAVVSEKAAVGEMLGTYTFVISKDATKVDVQRAVKDVYGVLPAKVRVVNVEGKKANSRFRGGKKADWKKAVVTLPKGKTISIHEGV